jgi:hypothetical protein
MATFDIRHRTCRSGQLMDIAIVATLAAMVGWILMLHH